MDREQQVEWLDLERGAMAAVRATPEAPKGYQMVASLLIEPSLEGSRNYWVALPPRPEIAIAKAWRRLWSRNLDSLKFESPIERMKYGPSVTATIETLEVDLPRAQIEALLRPLAECRVPPRASDLGIVLDGTSYSLRLGTDRQGSEFRWWENAPSGWKALEDFGRELERAVENNEHRAG